MLSDEWLSRYGLLENFNASVTRTRTGTWTTEVTAIALCTSCSRAKNVLPFSSYDHHVNCMVFFFLNLLKSLKSLLTKKIYIKLSFSLGGWQAMTTTDKQAMAARPSDSDNHD